MAPKDHREVADKANSQQDNQAVAQKLFEDWKESVVKIQTDKGSGSGFFIDDSTVATNYHVIKGSRTFKAQDSNSQWYTLGAEVYADPVHDLALLKIHGKRPANVKPIPLAAGASDNAGVSVYHLGHPRGLQLELLPGVGLGACDERKYWTRMQAQSSAQRQLSLSKQLDNPQNNNILSQQLLVIEAPGVTHGSSGAPFLNAKGEAVAIVRKGVRNEDGTIYCASSTHLRDLIEKSRQPLNPDTPENEFFARKGESENGIQNYFRKLRHAPAGFFKDSIPLAIAATGAGLATQTHLNDGLLRATGLRMNVGLTVSGAALVPLILRDVGGLSNATDELTRQKYELALGADAAMAAGFGLKTTANFLQQRPGSLRMGRAGLVLAGLGLTARLAAEFIPNYYGVDVPAFSELK
jgi:hypothetical protein